MANSYRLECALRQAVETWMGDRVSGPWDDLLAVLSVAMDNGELTLTDAARIDYLLRETTDKATKECGVCECPMTGMAHATAGCPDPRLHEHSHDGLCRYCRAG